MRANDGWLSRQAGSEDDRREYEVERLILWTLESIVAAMDENEVTKAELAKRLGRSRAYVTKVLNGPGNLTLRTLAEFAWAAGVRMCMSAEPLREGRFVSSPVQLVRRASPQVVRDTSASMVDTEENDTELMTVFG